MRILEPGIEEILDRLGDADKPHGVGSSWRFYYPPSEDLDTADSSQLAALQAEDPDITIERDEDELLTNISSALTLSTRLRTLDRRATSEYMDRGLRVLLSRPRTSAMVGQGR